MIYQTGNEKNMMILVTGGAGYIGCHTLITLIEDNHQVVVVDNLSNSSKTALERVEKITGISIPFIQADVLDQASLKKIFEEFDIDAVIHFAGLKAVGESVEQPLRYYENNVMGTISLCQVMSEFHCYNLVFSSSATVYGDPESVPINENFPTSVTNPYGRSKLIVEEILQDLNQANPKWNIALLRYFNPAGAHKSGLIGEDPNGIPNNLLPYISQVAVGKLEKLSVFGGDYNTPDGTGVRDYIHVIDLAKGHLKALNLLQKAPGVVVFNLGTGTGYSVLEMIKQFERASSKQIPYEIIARRPGDIAECWANPKKAQQQLDWNAELGLEEMMQDQWNWQSCNPDGYRKDA